LSEEDRLIDVLRRVIESYCRAYEHMDDNYIAAQDPEPEFTRNSAFNWVSQGPMSDASSLSDPGTGLRMSSIPFVHPMLKRIDLDYEPSLLLYDTAEEIVGGLSYPTSRFSAASMERVVIAYIEVLRRLLEQPELRIRDLNLL
jgi:hypothetical protein